MSEFDRRQLELPASFDVSDRRLWEPGYAAEARHSLLTAGRTLNEALTLVKPFVDPLLDRSATGLTAMAADVISPTGRREGLTPTLSGTDLQDR